MRLLYDYGVKLKTNNRNNSSDLGYYEAQLCHSSRDADQKAICNPRFSW